MNLSRTPSVRFKGYEDEWEERKLGDVTESFDGKRIPIDSGLRVSGEYPYYGATGIIDYVDDYIFDGEYVLLAEDGANIIMRNYPVAYLTQGKFWLNNHAHIMRMKDGSNYFLVQMLEKIDYMKYNTGTAQPKLNSKIVKNIEFKLPHIEEQQKIGTFFKQLDDTIALHQRKLNLLNEQKKGFLQKMFPKNGEKIPEIRFAGFNDDWEERKLGDYVIIRSGWSPSNFDINNNANNLFIKVDDLNYSTRVQEESQVKVNILSKYKKMKKSSTIFPKRGAAIMTNKVRMLGEDSYMDTNMMALEPKGIDPEYLYTFINKIGLYKIADTSTIPQINNKHIEPYLLLIPSLEEQQKIGSFFKQLDGTIALHQRKIDELKSMKKSMLQKMFV